MSLDQFYPLLSAKAFVAPTITVGPPSLAAATVGTAYSGTMTATGGTAPNTFAVTAGALPTGLVLNGTTGAITGTPTVPGTYNFTVTATDSLGFTGARAYNVAIASTAAPPTTFTARTNPLGAVASNDVYWSPEQAQFIAVGVKVAAESGSILTSPDGINWTSRNATMIAAGQFFSVTWSATLSLWVASGNGGMHTSPDGITWTQRPTTLNNAGASAEVIWSGAQFATGNSTKTGTLTSAHTSPDGITWTETPGTALNVSRSGVAFGVGLYVTVGNSTQVQTSPDGITWTQRVAAVSASTSVTFGNGIFVAVGTAGLIQTSPDGITWTARTSGISTALNDVAFSNGYFIAVGASGRILSSPDGITWTSHASGTTQALNGSYYSPALARHVVVGAAGVILTSP